MSNPFEIIQPISSESLILAAKWFAIFFTFQYLGAKFLPSRYGYGFPTQQGVRKDYDLTGLQMFILTQGLYFLAFKFANFSLIPLIQQFWSFFVVVNIFCVLYSLFLYIMGKVKKAKKFQNPTILPDFLFEFWCGVEQNPVVLGVDIKMFFYQPSLLGLHLIILSFAEYQWRNYAEITPQMIVFQLFWWLYLFTHYIREEFMLSTWDIIEEHFGFMLVWGDMIYVPFWYSIAGWYMIDVKNQMSAMFLGAIVIVHLISHFIFRVSNWQKYEYKKFGMKAVIWGKHPQLLEDKLLISGFWGIGRHLNYTGEIFTYVTFSLCTGSQSLIPYLLPFSLIILLSQRAWRDDQKCQKKYGSLWIKYCKVAKFKMFPGLY